MDVSVCEVRRKRRIYMVVEVSYRVQRYEELLDLRDAANRRTFVLSTCTQGSIVHHVSIPKSIIEYLLSKYVLNFL